MATFDYSEMQAVAEELITEFGQQGTITRLTAPDPVLGGTPVETAYPCTLVPMAYQSKEIDGTVIKDGDTQIYISSVGLAIEPQPGDIVPVNGKNHRIVNGDPNKFDGVTPVVFIVQGRLVQ